MGRSDSSCETKSGDGVGGGSAMASETLPDVGTSIIEGG